MNVTPYNEKQASYDAEVTAGIAAKPDGLYLIATPVDGATVARAWISQGGVDKFLLNDGMNSDDFIKAVSAKSSQRRLRHVVGPLRRRHRLIISTPITRRSPTSIRALRRPRKPMTPARSPASAIAAAATQGPRRDPRRHLQGDGQVGRSDPRRQGRFREGARPDQRRQADPLRRRDRADCRSINTATSRAPSVCGRSQMAR